MNRSELVDQVVASTGLDKKQAESAVMAVVDSIVSEAKSGNKVSIFGFGTFTPTSKAARMGRNPQTGAPVKIAASKGVKFAPASAFKLALNSRGAAAKKSAAKKSGATKATAKKAPARKATAAKAASANKTVSAKASAKKAPAAKTTRAAKKR